MHPPPDREDLAQRLLDLLRQGAGASVSEADFDRLALAVFSHQFAHDPVYAAFCRSRGVDPGSVEGWLAIPAVPTDAFKAAALTTGDPAAAELVFRTSGTTGGAARRGTHYLREARFYRASLLAGFRAALLPDRERIRIVSLVPAAAAAPDSSLSYMIECAIKGMGAEGSRGFVGPEGLRTEALLETLTGAGEPVLVAGTSFAFVHLADALAESGTALSLPPGSRAMDTGGFKGKSREVGKSELYALIEGALGIPAPWIVNEYGMTEMSSQFYDGVVGAAGAEVEARVHRGPPWVRSAAVDPETLAPLPAGEVGILRHVDLANLDSVAALQTADLGRVAADGGVTLIGRAPGAEPRGCSIAMDTLLRAMVGEERPGSGV